MVRYFRGGQQEFKKITGIVLLNVVVFETFIPYFNSAWINCCFFGFCIAKNEKYQKINTNNLNRIIVATAIIMNGIRIVMDYILDIEMKNEMYEALFIRFCNYAHVFLGCTFFLLIYSVFSKKKIKNKYILKVCDTVDDISYECYLVHQFFILGPFSLMNSTKNMGLNISLIWVLILIFGITVHEISIFLKEKLL